MVLIELTKGAFAIVDDEDVELISRFSWQLNDSGYAVANVGVGRKHVTIERMHRMILRAPDGMDVDHINGNRRDNRKCNLRLATRTQNHWNQRKRSRCSSEFKGVCWHNQNKRWRARINVYGKEIALGCFSSEIEAAKAYNEAAKKYFGDFALLNEIQE
ncbi:HNH endonuclease [Klebsiella variicola]|uniref:HNH endonuclease n=1 Tax=Klebsiella variicola TaxID=244366 RepID=UPI00109BA212|nr:HNH endonuclease [Klebsiella variicola]VGP71076.1 hypothetical protein SB5387_01015 [Klebsiella variicola]